MNKGLIGACLGIVFGSIWVFEGFFAMLLVAGIGAIGWMMGRFIKIDLDDLGKKIQKAMSK